MLFCSISFMVFFAVLLCIYWSLPWQRARVWLLVAASFYFYAAWNKWLAIILCISTSVDYLLALSIEKTQTTGRRKLMMCVSLFANLGLLCYFKYTNFFLLSLDELLISMGASHWFRSLQVILPIGISFYTFEAINYIVDVYSGRIRAERNFGDFVLFIMFFPHLVAGPIVRARDFLPQIKRPKRCDWVRMHLGLQYFLMGLFKKLAIADRMAQFADPVFDHALDYQTPVAWIAMFAYAMQVYGDFSGYTDMAIGTAHMLGYKLAENFNMPFLAPNIAEFWKRWHMSLSSWLRDYIFIPLGGSRNGEWKTRRNLIITLTICGLWHGAAWQFVGFGFLQGWLLIVHRAFRKWCKHKPKLDGPLRSPLGTISRVTFTFLCFCLSLIVFRSSSFGHAFEMYTRLFTAAPHALLPASPDNLLPPMFGFWLTASIMLIGHLLGRSGIWIRPALRLPAPMLGFSYALLFGLALLLEPQGAKPFIYFQF
ncbi:MAG TPA: MBOAT family protein [Gemmataceae bacterium]|jgi:alginate O-acetyltransferase complex protein AlgI